MLELEKYNLNRLKQTDNKRMIEKVYPFLLTDEEIISVYKNSHNLVVFSDKRIMTISLKGLFGKKNELTTFPFSKVNYFSSAANGNRGGSIALNFGLPENVIFEFVGNCDVTEISKVIAEFALK